MEKVCSSCKEKVAQKVNLLEETLVQAAKVGHVDCIEELIAAGADVNYFDYPKTTALMRAVENNHPECVKLLIESGSNVNIHEGYNDTAILFAKRADCLELLIKAGADVNIQSSLYTDDPTALMKAARRSDEDSVKLLIEAGADVNIDDRSGDTPIMEAVKKESSTAIVKLLLEAGANVNARGRDKRTPLMKAALNKTSDEECIITLVEAGASVNDTDRYSNTALNLAAATGHSIGVKALINMGARVDLSTKALALAAGGGYYECVKLLLEAGADVNSCSLGDSALRCAIVRNYDRCAQLLVASGADVNTKNKQGNTLIIEAVMKNNVNNLKLLLQANAKINVKKQELNAFDIYGKNLLQKNHSKDVVMLLFAAGENLTADTRCKLDPEIREELEPGLNLKRICREAIRKHLINLDPHSNLFGRIPHLGLPKSLVSFLLYHLSLEEFDITDK